MSYIHMVRSAQLVFTYILTLVSINDNVIFLLVVKSNIGAESGSPRIVL